MTAAGAPVPPGLRGFVSALPREGRWLLSTATIQHVGRGMTLPFTLIYLHEVRGIDLDRAGVLVALIFAVALVFTAPAGYLTDRLGARAVIIGGSVAQLLGAAVLAFATTETVVAVACSLLGLANAIAWPAFNALIASVVTGELRQRYFGVNFALLNLGIGAGGLIGGLFVDVARPSTFTTIYLIDAAAMLIPIALLLWPLRHVGGPVRDEPDGRMPPTTGAEASVAFASAASAPAPHTGSSPAPAPGYLAIIRQRPVITIAALTMLTSFVGYGQLEGGMQAFARTIAEASTQAIGIAFAANTAVIVLLQFAVLERISGRRRTRVFQLLCVVWSMAWLTLGASGLLPATLAASVLVVAFGAVFALGETLLQPTIPAITNDLATDRERGRYNAVTSAAHQLGAVLGPIAAGLLLGAGWGVGFIATMVLGCGGVALLALVLERQVSPEVNGVGPRPAARTPEPEPPLS